VKERVAALLGEGRRRGCGSAARGSEEERVTERDGERSGAGMSRGEEEVTLGCSIARMPQPPIGRGGSQTDGEVRMKP
jgi:hypothetical protein